MKAARLTKEEHKALFLQRRSPSKPLTREAQELMVENWNRAHPQLGTKVRVLKDDGSTVDTIATTKAYMLEGHTAVIFLAWFKGCYSLARVTAL